LGQIAARDRALGNASAHAAKLSERNRLLLAVALEADPRGDPTRRAELLDELLTRFPDVEEAYPAAYALYHPVSGVFPNLEKLLTIARTGVTAIPASPQMRNRYASALTEAGRFEEAVREFEQYARLSPREPNPFDSLGGVYLALGAPAKAIDSYSRALAIDPSFPSGTGLAYAFGMLGRYEEAIAARPSIVHVHALLVSRTGRYQEAERILRSGLARALIDDNMFIVAGLHLTSAVLSLERKDYAGCSARSARSATRCLQPLPDSRDTGRSSQIRWTAWRILARVVRARPRRVPIRRLARSGRPTRSSAAGTGPSRESWHSCAEIRPVQPVHSPQASLRGAAYHWTSRVRSSRTT
jgi:Tfp pilus assembly protein PilF